ncbi:MAG: hypothetical protein ACRCZD_01790, partial [Phycicoccus sp.]
MSSEGEQSGRGPWSPWERPAPAPPGTDVAAAQPAPSPPGYDAAPPPPVYDPRPSHPPVPPGAQTWATQTAPASGWPPAGGDAAPPPERPRRRPGWGALVGVSVVAALFAGTAGGIAGA